ncbi:hypothetical protein K1T71_009527 [Dendrolimus kikuchii]|uniref:Uncharacterized protein n=1 Tax=Dendrolimus kikuchii TaxID=765133 RepID=A0ACC1CRV9_9NEOP|nr:hypothetical protein K1T71_009527 [Dendrolimus kikuchii]
MAPRKGNKVAVPRKKANGYKKPAPIPVGEVINDVNEKKKWQIGPSIGVGGFGEIYSACVHGSPKKATSYPFVIKIEPHENGPLFVEKHFYIRNTNKDDIAKFMKSNNLSSLGMPTYFGNGSHEYNGEKYRYLVLERYGKDLWTIFKECGRSFPPVTVFQLGLQMLDVLEYIHSRNYVHADLKGANILMGLKKGTENQAYLVDFGLATRVNEKEFKPDPKCAHNGTIEYTSRDAHLGVATMRGDLEILAYNMLQWIIGELPWEKSLKEPKTVQSMKESFMKNVRSNIQKHKNVPDALIKFFEYINAMKPKDVPDYTKCRQIFETYLKSHGKNRKSKLEFSTKSTQKKRDIDNVNDSENEVSKENKIVKEKNNEVKKKRSRKPKIQEDSEETDEDTESVDSQVEKRNELTTKRRHNKRDINNINDSENDVSKENQIVKEKNSEVKKKHSRKPKIQEDNKETDLVDSQVEKGNRRSKRKSSEPAVVVKVKKTRLNPKRTPPAKKNHTNIATQTPVDRDIKNLRQVSFDSPISEVMGQNGESSVNSSGDIFDDSFVVEDKKIKKKRKLLSCEETVVKRVVTKRTTERKGRSRKDAPTLLNGQGTPS